MNTKKYLLTAKEIEQMQAKKITHFLNPNAVRLNKSLGDAVGMNHLGFHMISVEAGKETTEYHRHHYEEEAIYVLSGTATLIIEGDSYRIAKGDFVGLPRNEVAHTIINDSSEILSCLVVGQRLAQDIADYPKQSKRLYRNDGSLNLVDHDDVQFPVLSASQNISPDDIIDFWYSDNIREGWFNSTPALDFHIREKFEAVWNLAVDGKLGGWRETAKGCLALIILFDQFPLNMYRGQPKSFQTEQDAVAISKFVIQKGFDKEIPKEQLAFAYMPLMHSENINDQTLAVDMFKSTQLESNIRFAEHHKAIIEEFGRFPHRNSLLGRSSTQEELDYLNSEKAFTG